MNDCLGPSNDQRLIAILNQTIADERKRADSEYKRGILAAIAELEAFGHLVGRGLTTEPINARAIAEVVLSESAKHLRSLL